MKKLSLILLALLLIAGMFTACTENVRIAEPTPTGTTKNQVQRQRTGGTLKVGTVIGKKPFAIKAEGGVVSGYMGVDMGVAYEIAASFDKDIKIVEMNSEEELINAVANSELDVAISRLTVKEENKNRVDYTIPYYTAVANIVVKADSSVLNSNDLNGKKAGIIEGYMEAQFMEKYNADNNAGITFTKAGSYKDLVAKLLEGSIDVIVIDSVFARIMNDENIGKLKLIEDPSVFKAEEYAVAVRKNDPELLKNANEVIEMAIGAFAIDSYAWETSGK